MGSFVSTTQFQLRPIDYIVVHHSATADTTLENFDAIRDYHMNVRGWRDIGYHAVAEMVNGSPVVQYGRPEHIPGAHVVGHNANTLGICIVGNYSENPINLPLIRQAAFRVVAPWCVQYHVPVDHVVGHREVPGTSTQCPGLNFDMNAFRVLVNQYILYQNFPDEGEDVAV